MGTERSLTYDDKEKQRRYDVAYLRMAMEWARLSYCERMQVGALIVKDGIIISDGYNGAPTGFDNRCEDENNRTHWYILHAEANAITKVARSTNSAQRSTLYLTLSPCKDCSKLILQAGIKRVVYTREYRDGEGPAMLEKAGIEVERIELEEENQPSTQG